MFIWCMDPAMPGEDYDTSAMMTFSRAETGSESGRRREDHGGAVTRDSPDRLVSGALTGMTAFRAPRASCMCPSG